MNKPFFSVIIPVYKVEAYLHQCVNSVLAQDFEDFEIILVDDGSPDNCPRICDEYAAKDHRVKVIHKKNGGLSDARNYGIEVAEGEYILFLDSDDYWNDVTFFSELYKTLLSIAGLDIINFGWIKYFQNSETYIPDKRDFSIIRSEHQTNTDYIITLLKNDLFIASACNKCIKAQFIYTNNLSFKKGIRSEDMDWCGRILLSMPEMTCIDKKCYVYRQQVGGSITANVDMRHIEDIIFLIKEAVEKSDKFESKIKEIYLSFFAVQYLTLLINVYSDTYSNDSALRKEVFEHRSILRYNLNYKVKVANVFMRLLGIELMSKLFRLYILIKQL